MTGKRATLWAEPRRCLDDPHTSAEPGWGHRIPSSVAPSQPGRNSCIAYISADISRRCLYRSSQRVTVIARHRAVSDASTDLLSRDLRIRRRAAGPRKIATMPAGKKTNCIIPHASAATAHHASALPAARPGPHAH